MERTWTDAASKLLKGKKITEVRYLSKKEARDLGWNRRSIVLQLNDGTVIYPSRDDEGNDGGALFTTNNELPIIPVLP